MVAALPLSASLHGPLDTVSIALLAPLNQVGGRSTTGDGVATAPVSGSFPLALSSITIL
ncbi:hypothetical protein FHS21_006268 [Phyllobacterium trifolii]|jgi:hypothetical protein|uniref:Uncharacterized protein n=1 Tax=Phyllobacterium trifolii TaxID=300193 RepID=A0A839UMJ4_9HYPH|nr:hypothetical protein [Phyllobacterium trifolii]